MGLHDAQLPGWFADRLQRLKLAADPRYAATLRAANDAGWSQQQLAHALGVSGGRISQLVRSKHATTADPLDDIPVRGANTPPAPELSARQTVELLALHSAWRASDDPEALDRFGTLLDSYDRDPIVSLSALAAALDVGEDEVRGWQEEARAARRAREDQAQAVAAWEAYQQAVRDQESSGDAPRARLKERNLVALEDWPGPDARWWVQCKFCGRCWHAHSVSPRKCPHIGADDGVPPVPTHRKRPTIRASKRHGS